MGARPADLLIITSVPFWASSRCKTMQDSFQRYLSAILESTDDDNGGDVLELTFDLQRLKINNLEDFQRRETESEVQDLIQEYRNR